MGYCSFPFPGLPYDPAVALPAAHTHRCVLLAVDQQVVRTPHSHWVFGSGSQAADRPEENM
jgi:hypothetical protein